MLLSTGINALDFPSWQLELRQQSGSIICLSGQIIIISPPYNIYQGEGNGDILTFFTTSFGMRLSSGCIFSHSVFGWGFLFWVRPFLGASVFGWRIELLKWRDSEKNGCSTPTVAVGIDSFQFSSIMFNLEWNRTSETRRASDARAPITPPPPGWWRGQHGR